MGLLGSRGLRLSLPDLPGGWSLFPPRSPQSVAGGVHGPQHHVKGASHTPKARPEVPGEFPQQLRVKQPLGPDSFLNAPWGRSHARDLDTGRLPALPGASLYLRSSYCNQVVSKRHRGADTRMALLKRGHVACPLSANARSAGPRPRPPRAAPSLTVPHCQPQTECRSLWSQRKGKIPKERAHKLPAPSATDTAQDPPTDGSGVPREALKGPAAGLCPLSWLVHRSLAPDAAGGWEGTSNPA